MLNPFKPMTVLGATKALDNAVKHLAAVTAHHRAQATRKLDKVADLAIQAANLKTAVADHHDEASRAENVAAKITALLA